MIHQQRWTLKKIEQRLRLITPLVYRERVALPPFFYQSFPQGEPAPVTPDFLDETEWPKLLPGTPWGQWRTGFVLRTTLLVPREWAAEKPVALYLPLGDAGDFCHPEALVYVDGQPIAACDRFHQEIVLPDWVRDGQIHRLVLSGWTGLGGSIETVSPQQLLMGQCELLVVDEPTRQFVALVHVAVETAKVLGESDPARGRILNALHSAFLVLDTREPWGEAFYGTVAAASEVLQQGLLEAGPPLDVHIIAAGHAHIDVAWLWTLGQTRQKARRTFHTALHLMRQYPAYHFSQSQPQLYDWMRQDDPALFTHIRQKVAEGRWEALGGMWVEADCNLTGAESLARQFLLGRTFFRQQFGPAAESPVLWLPDVFGYAWNLPQLIKQAGLAYFFTIKIGWSQYNRLPYDSFWWQGLDGTRVLTHFSPTPEGGSTYASTYNAKATPQDTLGTWHNFRQKEQSNLALMAFGHGDGGGGPTPEMLENIGLMGQFPGLPQITHGRVGDFFRQLEAESGAQLPVWKGELYLEYHRGTYTTQSRNKRANRKAEFALHDADFLLAVASVAVGCEPLAVGSDQLVVTSDQLAVSSEQSPVSSLQSLNLSVSQSLLRRAWELVCLNQFHDIIPGSSIGEVYVESLAQYDEVMALVAQVKEQALAVIAAATGHHTFLINPTSFPQHPIIRQLDPGPLPPYSLTPWPMVTRPQTFLSASSHHLENEFVRLELDETGDISRFYDKVNDRELIPAGLVSNQFQAFEDRPMYWDAWDIDIYYDDRMWLAEPAERIVLLENEPYQATIEIQRRILHSTYRQRLTLSHHSPRLDIQTDITWQERHILLKVAFPVHLFAPTATFDIQWGNVERPTHRNTSWDWARFETCAHKWVDVSEGDYGFSLLNDGKYGHDVQDNTPYGTTIRLSLLRSPTMPDPEADQGEHSFAYSLWPHRGRWDCDTLREAYGLNDPVFVGEGGSGQATGNSEPPAVSSFVVVDKEHVVIETVKVAEDGHGVVVRLYEAQRRRGLVTLRVGFAVAAAYRTNLLEDNEEALPVNEGQEVQFPIRPYEIVTLRLVTR